MADVNDIIAHGFGSWSTVNSVPTLGFEIGEAAVTVSVYYSILEAVHSAIQDIGLEAIEDENIELIKVYNERETVVPGLPGVLVYPLGPENINVTEGTNERDDIGYPVAVAILDQDRQQSDTGLPADAEEGTQDQSFRFEEKLIWREQIRKEFINQRLTLTGATPNCTNRCTLEPQAVVNTEDWLATNIWISVLVFRFWTRETRGN
jgi:hypothetical protein